MSTATRISAPNPGAHRERLHSKINTATPSTVRDVNRFIVLNLIRLHQPISRVSLSRRTGIFRSNVSAIVDQLIQEGFLVERRATPEGRGRVPFMLSLNESGFRTLGVSIRLLRTSVASSGLAGRIQRTFSFETPQNPAELVRRIARIAKRLQNEEANGTRESFRQFGISVPGLVNSKTGDLLWLPALPEYSGFALRSELERQTGVPTAIDNDGNLGAMAELWLGEKEIAGLENFVFLEVGDAGVGAGLILNRAVYAGHDSTFASEFGHMIIDPAGPKCSCGRPGCWELYVCDRAVWRRYCPETKFDTARFDNLIERAQRGEPRAVQVFREAAHYLSLGISNIVFSLNPEVIIMAGKITKVWNLVRQTLENDFSSPKIKLRIRPARLEAEELFLHGAISLAVSQAFSKPKLGW